MFTSVAVAPMATILQQQRIVGYLRIDTFGQSIRAAATEIGRGFILVQPSLGLRFEAVSSNRVATLLVNFIRTFALVSSRGTTLGTVAFVCFGQLLFGWRRRWYLQQTTQVDPTDEGNVVQGSIGG